MNRKHTFRFRILALLAVAVISTAAASQAALAAGVARVIGAGSNIINVVVADPVGGGSNARELQRGIATNLAIVPFINQIPSQSIPGGSSVPASPAAGDFKRFLDVKAQLLITANWVDSNNVELRTFEVGEGKFMFGNRYAVAGGSDGALDVADKFSADLLEAIIGRGDLFRSTMAFVRTAGKNKKDVWAVKANGRHLRKLTNMPGEALSPTWSNDGRFVLFTHIDARTHALGVWDARTRSVQRIKFPGNTVIGPSFMPDNRVAVSLTDGRNPSIFLLSHSFQKERRLDESSAIDVSPSVDASGTKMVFTSNRLGNPHIFLKDLRTGSVRRITTNGRYNTDPSISADGTVVAFARQEGGGHRIYVYDLVTETERQITFGPGSDEEPTFAPDSYFIAFMSSRGGQKRIYLTTREGGTPKVIPTGQGDAAFPAWGQPR